MNDLSNWIPMLIMWPFVMGLLFLPGLISAIKNLRRKDVPGSNPKTATGVSANEQGDTK